MNPALELLTRCRSIGLTIRAKGDHLGVAPATLAPPELLAEIRSHKPALLALLADGGSDLPPDQAAWIPTARQIIGGEFDGGTRSELESVLIGVRSIPHSACHQARARLESLLGRETQRQGKRNP